MPPQGCDTGSGPLLEQKSGLPGVVDADDLHLTYVLTPWGASAQPMCSASPRGSL